MTSLPKPPDATSDPEAVEVMSAWIANESLHIVLKQAFFRNRNFEEEWAWGVLLADTMRHLANAIADERGDDATDVLEGIHEALETELAKATSQIKGSFVGKRKSK